MADSTAQIVVPPTENLTELVRHAPPGATFHILPGKHYVGNIQPKDRQIFEGAPGAILSGAVRIGPFTRRGNHWRAAGPKPLSPSHGECDDQRLVAASKDCLLREALFAEDVRLERVSRIGQLGDGAWFQDRTTAEIVLGFDPENRTVELSYRDAAFVGSAREVTIRGFIIQHFATAAQHGAIHGDETLGWTVLDNQVRFNSGVGIRVGNHMRVLRNRVLYNGQIGIGGSGEGISIEQNEIAGNNTHGYAPAWEAGATKFVETSNLVVVRNCVRENRGHGIWTDYHNMDSLIFGNWSVKNLDTGIFHELSGRALMANNVSAMNGTGGNTPWSSQILVSGSIDTLVWKNRVEIPRNSGHGIIIIEEDRENGDKFLHSHAKFVSRGNVVMGNEITFAGPAGRSGFSSHSEDASEITAFNRFEDNEIIVVDGGQRRFMIGSQTMDMAGARSRGQELRSRLSVKGASPIPDLNCPKETVPSTRG